LYGASKTVVEVIHTQKVRNPNVGDIFYDTTSNKTKIYMSASGWTDMTPPTETPYTWQSHFSIRPRKSLLSGKTLFGKMYRRRRWDARAQSLGITLHGYEYLDLREVFIWKLKNGG
jgi:hypothetical protein